MINGYSVEGGRLRPEEAPLDAMDRIIWIDLDSPTPEEAAAAGAALGIELPTRADMEEIEDSSRLYTENGAAFMTANLPSRVDTEEPVLAPVTFILAGTRLVTLRYHEPRAFRTFSTRAMRIDMGCSDGPTALVALLEVTVDRLADILEKIGRDVELLSRAVFRRSPDARGGGPDYLAVLKSLGRHADLLANVVDSLVTLERLVAFLNATQKTASKDLRLRLKTMTRDTRFLDDHASALSGKLTFLLDATLGMISIEQNAIIKIFSVAAVVFLPPTLIASIYGMNFAEMPELGWIWGYPFALLLMVLSAVVSFGFFKSRGWL
jgi:magnesium transporter